jgi:DNA polymerase-1
MSDNFLRVHEPTELDAVAVALSDTTIVGVDCETTGLDPRRDRVRILSLAVDTVDGGTFTYLIDCFSIGVDLSLLWPVLAEKELLFHNAAFDLGFLMRLGLVPAARIRDTLLMARLLTAGTREPCDLQHLSAKLLQVELDKTHQTADWSGELSPSQLRYAALDAAILVPLYRKLKGELEPAKLLRALEIEERCLPAIVWLGIAGVPFDTDAWRALTQQARRQVERLAGELDQMASRWSQADLFGTPRINWDSTQQVQQLFAAAGVPLESTNDGALAEVEHPLAERLRDYRAARKQVTAYGEKFLEHVGGDGRIYSHWHQLGASSGRMSGSDPNLQQMPRGADYRRCVRAPDGRALVKADYSQIELRIAAKIAGESRMIEAYRNGADLHTLTAQRVLGMASVTADQRQLAKALNFGLLYGMGAKGFRQYAKAKYGVELTPGEAEQYRKAFFDAYPALRLWHRAVGAHPPRETRTLTGRRVLFSQARFNEQLNCPVQGTGADGLKLALALLWERRHEAPGATPVLAVHDEIVVECAADEGHAVGGWLRKAMLDAMAPLIDPVPVEIEVKVAATWGG